MKMLASGGRALCIAAAACVLAGSASAGSWKRADVSVQGCAVTVYTDPDFQGASWTTRNGWAAVGWEFRDRIKSIKVRSGVWQFYNNNDFNGQIETLYPGHYGHLRPTVNNVIRSFRCARAT